MKVTRRQFAATMAGAVGAAAAVPPARLRFSVCNETFLGTSGPKPGLPQGLRALAEQCRAARRIGYEGIEIAPFTLAGSPAALSAADRAAARVVMDSEGVAYAGMHAFLSAPPGLHLTAPDAGVRERSWAFFRDMIDLAGDLGPESIMVLGSGKQRQAIEGVSRSTAMARITEGLAKLALHAEARRVTVLLEPLAAHLCNVVNSLDEAVGIVREIGSPAVATMFDTHNAVGEPQPHAALIRRYASLIRHAHLNEVDGSRPGTGRYDFRSVLTTLQETGFGGWASLEVFEFEPSGEQVAREAFTYLSAIRAAI